MSYSYTVAIRTLGTAGEKYQKLLNSLERQTVSAESINVYIAEGYPLPKETIGMEKYKYVKKGMLSQRALDYNDVHSEYILFLDDDIVLPSDAVETMFKYLHKYKGDAISPDIFDNSKRGKVAALQMAMSGRMAPRRDDGRWGYKVMRNGGYSYNKTPSKEVYESQTNAGACFLCRKAVFQSINLMEETWIDSLPYPLGEDQITYYKMHKKGFKILTYYNHNILHLDGGNNMSIEKEKSRLYGDLYFKVVFWHRFIYKPEKTFPAKLIDCLAMVYTIMFSIFISLLKLRFDILLVKYSAIRDSISFVKSSDYKSLPLV